MSTFILDDSSLNAIALTLEHLAFTDPHGGLYLESLNNKTLAQLNEFGICTDYNPNNRMYDGIYRLVRLWHIHNAKSFRACYGWQDDNRYKEYNGGKLEAFRRPRLQTNADKVSLMQLYKSLLCLAYNTDEPDQILIDIVRALANKIIQATPEYNSAEWG